MSIRTIRSLTLVLCILVPKLGFGGLYVAPPTVGPPYQLTNGSLSAGVSFSSVDSAVYSDPTYVEMWQTHDVVAAALSITPGSDNLYYVDLNIGSTLLSGAAFVAGGPNDPTSTGNANTPTGIFVLQHPVTREADGSYETSTLLLLYPLATFTESPISQLYVQGAMWSGGETPQWYWVIQLATVPEPSVVTLALSTLAALAFARRITSGARY